MLYEILSRASGETVEKFAGLWHGDPAQIDIGETAPDLPRPLARFLRSAQLWPDLVVQNDLVAEPSKRDDRFVFYVENQGVCSWSTEADSSDPPVWVETEGSTLMEEEPLSRFLITVAIFEAVMGASEGASAAWLHRDGFGAGFDVLEPLPYSAWRGCPPGASFYASHKLLGVACANPAPESDEYVSVWVATRDRDALSVLDQVIDESWEFDSRRSK